MFQVRLATPNDLEVILGLIDGAAGWLKTKGTDQWAKPWPSAPERDARVLRGILACRTWLVEDRGIPVATVTYRPDGNPELWTDDELHERAVYMSRLVISRAYAGQDVGATLTDWAGARARREYGAESLRIDVWTSNFRLHSYYEMRGFRFARRCPDRTYPSAALFYKPTADIKDSARSKFSELLAISAAPSRCESLSPQEASGHDGEGSIGGHHVLPPTRDLVTKQLHASQNLVTLRPRLIMARIRRPQRLNSRQRERESARRRFAMSGPSRLAQHSSRVVTQVHATLTLAQMVTSGHFAYVQYWTLLL